MKRSARPPAVAKTGARHRRGVQSAFVPPYPPSWIDRLLWALDRAPWSPWGGFVAIATALTVVGLLYARVIGSSESPLTFTILVVPLAVIRYLDAVALRSLDRFHPALDASEEELRRLAYELTTMSRAAGLWVTSGAIAIVIVSYLAIPAFFPELAGKAWYEILAFLLLYGLASTIYLTLPVYALRLLRRVSLIHRQATNINLLQPNPLYAFSALTVRAGIGLLIVGYVGWLFSDPTQRLASFVILGPMVLAATGAFVLPLYGMHVRLAQQKERLMAEHQARLDAVLSSLHDMVARPNSARLDALHKVLSALMIERDLLAKAPTWPWRPGTLGSFASAVLLPIVILLVARLLERL